jgi:hypothetical protein
MIVMLARQQRNEPGQQVSEPGTQSAAACSPNNSAARFRQLTAFGAEYVACMRRAEQSTQWAHQTNSMRAACTTSRPHQTVSPFARVPASTCKEGRQAGMSTRH